MDTQTALPEKKSFIAANMAYILAFVVTIIWGGLTIYITMSFFKLAGFDKTTDLSVIMAMWGALTGQEATILSYYFGSSQGSSDKQKTIDKMTTPTPTPGVETRIEKTDVIADPDKKV